MSSASKTRLPLHSYSERASVAISPPSKSPQHTDHGNLLQTAILRITTILPFFALSATPSTYPLLTSLLLLLSRTLTIPSIKTRTPPSSWHGASEPSFQDNPLVLLSGDRWTHITGAVDDLKTITSGAWLQPPPHHPLPPPRLLRSHHALQRHKHRTPPLPRRHASQPHPPSVIQRPPRRPGHARPPRPPDWPPESRTHADATWPSQLVAESGPQCLGREVGLGQQD